MSLLNNIKSAFGFGGDSEEDDALDIYAQTTTKTQETACDDQDGNSNIDNLTTGIFDRVLEIFNQSLPDFLAKSVDPERQKQLLYDALDQSTKSHLQSLEISVKARCEQMWSQERARLQEEAEAQKRHAEDLEKTKQELNDKRLSADRQKRALSDRVRDLETQVLTLEAEKEQYEIESKCMVNKTKAAAVLENELEELRAENLQLRQEKLASKNAANPNTEPSVQTEEMETLKSEIAKLKESLEAAAVKDQMNETMFAEFQKKAADASKELHDAQAAAEQAQEEIKIKDAQIADLKKEAAEKEANHAESAVSIEELEAIQRQIEMFEEVRAKLNANIETLKANLKEAQAENETLRETIKSNLLDSAAQQKELQAQIDELKNEAAKQPAAYPHAEMPTGSANVDDLLNGTDWLISIPEKESAMHDVVEESDFGYQEPAKKPRISDNDSQLSLFDFD